MLQLYNLGILTAGILNTFIGLIIYFKNRKALSNILFGFVSLFFAIWCYSWAALLFIGADGELTIFFARLLNFGAVFIPFFYFHWIISILKLSKKERISIIVGYIIALFFGILSWSNWYIKGIHSILFFPNWPTAGPLYKWYLMLGYFPFVFYTIHLLFKHVKISNDRNRKNQLKYVILVTILGFGAGALNFPLMYKINPFGSLGEFGMFVGLAFFIPFPILLSYTIVKYHFMDIKVILVEVLAGFAAIILFIDILLTNPFSWQFVILKVLILIIFICLGITLIRSVLKEVRQREKLEILTKKIEKAYEVEKRARKELQRLDKAKRQFMMATQHHLRTPLTSMRGYLDLLFGGSYGKIPPKIKEVMKKFMASTKNEIKIVNEFLDISQFQMGKKVVTLAEGVDVGIILKEAVEDVKLEAKARGIYLNLEIPDTIPKIKADEQKLKAAIYNIIDNAVKYTKKGGVTVKLKKINNKIQIIIKDTGVGISKEQQDELFTRLFERGEHAQKLFATGKGIGLYITAKIVEEHNGKIWAESAGEGKGSTFYIELPIK